MAPGALELDLSCCGVLKLLLLTSSQLVRRTASASWSPGHPAGMSVSSPVAWALAAAQCVSSDLSLCRWLPHLGELQIPWLGSWIQVTIATICTCLTSLLDISIKHTRSTLKIKHDALSSLWRICHHFLWGWKRLKKIYLRQSKLRYVKKNVVAIHLNGYGFWCFVLLFIRLVLPLLLLLVSCFWLLWNSACYKAAELYHVFIFLLSTC